MSAACPQSRQPAALDTAPDNPAGDADAPPRSQAYPPHKPARSQARFLRPGTPQLPPPIDRRSRVARMLKAERASLIAALGRSANAADLILIDEIARLRVRSAALAASPNASAREAVAIASLILEALRRLGIESAPAPAVTLENYLSARAGAAGDGEG